MNDLMRKIQERSRPRTAPLGSYASVRLGAALHFTPGHFREHFVDARGAPIAEGAEVDAVVDDDITGELARTSWSRTSRSSCPSRRGRRADGAPLMCLGAIARLDEAWVDEASGSGAWTTDGSCRVAFVPDAQPGADLLVHLGIPVEVSIRTPPARHAPCVQKEPRHEATRATGIGLAFVTACVSGVSIYVNGLAVKHFHRRDRLHDGEERGRRRAARRPGARPAGAIAPSAAPDRRSRRVSGSRSSVSP